MPEAYTFGGDAFQKVADPVQLAQTFTPRYDHYLNYIDLEVAHYTPAIFFAVDIFECDYLHIPFGDFISSSRWPALPFDKYASGLRVRFSMDRVLLLAGTIYAIVLVQDIAPLGFWNITWKYDSSDSQYHRGHRLTTPDKGVTWLVWPGSDFLFCEFGEPFTPPEPPPPISHFTILDIVQTLTYSGYHFLVTTNVPCHLYMYWTTKEPWTNPIARVRRGVRMPDDSRYCFVDFTENEQLELGDTLFHTFIKEPWPICETRYFVFRATIEGEWSPSISPIFTKHRADASWLHYILETWDWWGIPMPSMIKQLIFEPWSPHVTDSLYVRLVPGNNGAHVWRQNGTWDWDIDGADAVCGYGISTMNSMGSPARFLNITIPPGAIIIQAFITYRAWSNWDVDIVSTYIHAEKSLSPAPLSTIPDYFARPRTTSFIDWTPIPHWVDFTEYNSPDISILIQEVIDQPGWSLGNPIMIFWDDHDSRSTQIDFTERRAWQFVSGWEQNAPLLTVHYYKE